MAFVPLADGAEAELVHVLDSSICETTATFIKRPFSGTPTLEGLLAVVDNWWRLLVLPLLGSQIYYVRARVRSLETAGTTPVVLDIDPPLPGGYGGNTHPANVSARLNFRVVNLPGRLVGCAFVPGVPHGAVSGNTLHQDWKDAIFDAYVSLIDLAEANNWRWVVASRYENGSPRSAAVPLRIDFPEFTSPYVASRRSRLHNDPE